MSVAVKCQLPRRRRVLCDQSLPARLLFRFLRRSSGEVRLRLQRSASRWQPVGEDLHMNIDPADPMDRAFCLGLYEERLTRLIKNLVRPGDTCIDIGAQKGYISLLMAKLVGPAGHVVAFEPDARCAEALKSHLARNSFNNVTVLGYALGDRESTCTFVLSRQLGWSSRFPNELARTAALSETTVQVRRLDDVLCENRIGPADRIRFIKIDVEGSEPLVLAGAQRTLQTYRPTLSIEVNRASLRAGGFSVESIEDLLRPLGYGFFLVRSYLTLLRYRLALEPASMSEVGEFADVIAVPAERAAAGIRTALLCE